MSSRMNILIALPSEVAFDQLQPLVARTEVEISRVFDGPPALTMAVGSRFDLLVVGDPLSNIEFVDFLRRVRSPESACCRAPMLILTSGDPSAGVDEFLDESTRRCSIDSPSEEIESKLSELIGVAMRAKARLAVELSARLENESLQLYCQTVNVSEGGMRQGPTGLAR